MGYSHLLAVACAIGAATTDTDPIDIPLKEIWALNMPGTRNVRELEPVRENETALSKEERIRGSLVEHTRWSLNSNFWPPYGAKAGRGFIVAARGVESLREAHAVLAERNEPREEFSTGEELTLVFYAYECARSIYLDSVSREGNTIRVRYHFDAHRTLRMSTHFALIPLGRLSAGKMRVRMERLADTGNSERSIDPVSARRYVCDSFSFGVAAVRN